MRINRVGNKIFLGLLSLSSVILIIMSASVKTFYAGSLRENEINSQLQASNRTRDQFDFIMGIIDRAAGIIGSQPEILEVLHSSSEPRNARGDFSLNVYLQAMQDIQPFLGNVSVAGAEGQFISSSLVLKYEYFAELYQRYALQFLSGKYKDYFVNASGSSLLPPNTPRDLLTGVYPVYDIREGKLLGQVYLGLNYSLFQEMFTIAPTTNNEKLLILDTMGNIVYHHPAFISFRSILADYPELISAEECVIEGKVFDTDSFIVSDTSRVVGWRFIRIIDAKNIIGNTQRMQRVFNIVFALSIALSLVSSMFMSRILTKPVTLLFEACKRIESGDMSFRVNIRANDEMGRLGSTFNLVMDQIKADRERELVEQKRQNELKLDVLRSQINPHFLYNTLDSIRFLANLQEIHNIASMSQALINLLKYNLSTNTLAALGEETESVRNYVEIQKYRYGDIFDFHLDIESGTETLVISRFVLQPLVENCLIHGFDNIESGGEIFVRSRLEGDALCLEVINNGNEISEENLVKLNMGEKQNTSFNNIGVNNIRERISLQFGEKASLLYSSGSGRVTIATLRFPVQ